MTPKRLGSGLLLLIFLIGTILALSSFGPGSMNLDRLTRGLAFISSGHPDSPIELSDSSVNATAKKYPLFVLDFYISGCGPCQTMNGTLSELSGELKGQVVFGRINAKKNNITKRAYNITSYPTLLVFKDGTVVSRLRGNRLKSGLVADLKRIEPKLNTSGVMTTKAKPTPGSIQNQSALGIVPPAGGAIPLATLGEDAPVSPMLVTDGTFNFAIRRYSVFVIEGFTNWCSFCRDMNLTISELAGELKGQVHFGLIDAERNNNTRRMYNISSYPTIMIFKNGLLVDIRSGVRTKSDLIGVLKRYKPGLDISLVKPSSLQTALGQTTAASNTQRPKKTCNDIKKQDKPLMEAFVVSNCPFGLQMQRIFSELINEVPSLSENIEVRYIGRISGDNIISMHGQKEATENLRQICIREEQGRSYWSYISNFIRAGNSNDSLKAAGVDQTLVESCMADRERGFKYAQGDFNIAAKFGITGSPTLLLNEELASESDFGGRTAEAMKTLLCCSFKSAPEFCSMKLNSSRAASGFSSKN
jgi:thioredoxin 1